MNTPSSVADLGEHALIDLIRRRLPAAPPWVRVGVGDDAAVVEPVARTVEVLTVDALVEGIHFDRRFTPPVAIGHRALAANLSDLAAMGAEPRLALLSLVLPPALPADDFTQLIDGVLALAATHRVHVVGGNITRSPGPLMIDITAIGAAHPRRVLTRAGAKPGDDVYVTGCIGAAAAGLACLSDDGPTPADMAACVAAYLAPAPRVRVGLLLGRNRAASACVDLSDGLGDGLTQLATASRVGLTVDADTLPIEPGARAWFASHGQDPVSAAVHGGDDYELLFTVPARRRRRLAAVASLTRGVALTRIGRVVEGAGVVLTRDGRAEAVGGGYEHFR